MENNSDERIIDRAEMLSEIGRFTEAIKLLLPIIVRDPNNTDALWLLSDCYLNLGNLPESLKFAEKLLAIDAEDSRGHILRSIALSETENEDESLRSVKESLRLQPEDPVVLTNAAAIYSQFEHHQKALNMAQKLVKLTPASDNAHLVLGLCLTKSGQENFNQAKFHFRKALELNPLSTDAKTGLAMLMMIETDKDPEALKHLTEAIRLDPTNKEALQSLQILLNSHPFLSFGLFVLPIVLIGFLVAPLCGGIVSIYMLVILIPMYLNQNRLRKSIPEQLKFIVKSPTLQETFKFIKPSFAFYLRQFWLAYALACVTLILGIAYLFTNNESFGIISLPVYIACFMAYLHKQNQLLENISSLS